MPMLNIVNPITKAGQDSSGNIIIDTYARKDSLAAVATSGSYNDLLNKPTIPTKVSELTNDKGYLVATDSSGNVVLDAYALKNSPVFTGTPAAPTATAGTNTTQLATTAFVSTAISNLVNSSPATLDTLKELATALGNDPNFATTMTTALGNKVNTSDVVTTATANKILKLDANAKLPASITGNAATASAVAWSGITDKPASFTPSTHTQSASTIDGLSTVATSGSYTDLTNTPTIPTKVSELSNDSAFITSTASITGNAATATKATQDGSGNVITSTYLPLTGGKLTNQLIIETTTDKGNYNEGLRINKSTNNWAAIILGGNAGTNNGAPYINGGWLIASNLSNQLIFNNNDSTVGSGGMYLTGNNLTVVGTVTAPTFVGALTGNATTATTLQTARTIGLSGVTATSQSFNGSANITIPITAVPATLLTGTASISTTGNAATATKATQDASGNIITDTYETKANAITGLSVSGTTITYTKGSGTTGTITTQDNAVTNTLNTGTIAYVTGTTSATTNTGTQIFDTGVYIDSTAGRLAATSYNIASKATMEFDSTTNSICFNFL